MRSILPSAGRFSKAGGDCKSPPVFVRRGDPAYRGIPENACRHGVRWQSEAPTPLWSGAPPASRGSFHHAGFELAPVRQSGGSAAVESASLNDTAGAPHARYAGSKLTRCVRATGSIAAWRYASRRTPQFTFRLDYGLRWQSEAPTPLWSGAPPASRGSFHHTGFELAPVRQSGGSAPLRRTRSRTLSRLLTVASTPSIPGCRGRRGCRWRRRDG